MASEVKNPLDQLADPFREAADTYHWAFFETAGIEIYLPSWLSKLASSNCSRSGSSWPSSSRPADE